MSDRSGMLDAALALLIRVASAGLMFALQILLARLMPLDSYGGYVTFWTWSVALGSFGALGLAESGVRFLPRYQARGQWGKLSGFWRTGLAMVGVAALIIAAVGSTVALSLGAGEGVGLTILLVAIGVPLLAMEYFLEGVARGLGWFRVTTVPVYIVRPLLIAAGCLLLWWAKVPLDLHVVAGVVLGSMGVVTAAVALIIGLRIAGMARSCALPRGQGRLWLGASLPLLLASGLEDLLSYADIVLLSLLLPAEEVALYFASARSLALAGFVTYALYLVSGRRFALDLSQPDRQRLQQSVLSASRWTVWMTVLAVGATLGAGPTLLAAFGPQFAQGFPVMAVLGAGLVLRSLAGQAGEVLVVTGRQRDLIILSALVLCAHVTLVLALVPIWGPLGAAIATAIAMAMRTVSLVVVLQQREGLRVLSFAPPR